MSEHRFFFFILFMYIPIYNKILYKKKINLSYYKLGVHSFSEIFPLDVQRNHWFFFLSITASLVIMHNKTIFLSRGGAGFYAL
jgi:hypothetical protein